MTENLSVKKNEEMLESNLSQSMNAFLSLTSAAGNFYFNLFRASVQAGYQLNAELLKEVSNLNQTTSQTFNSVTDSTQQTFQNAVHNTQNTFNEQRLRNLGNISNSIDYELLAKLVAQEMKKSPA